MIVDVGMMWWGTLRARVVEGGSEIETVGLETRLLGNDMVYEGSGLEGG